MAFLHKFQLGSIWALAGLLVWAWHQGMYILSRQLKTLKIFKDVNTISDSQDSSRLSIQFQTIKTAQDCQDNFRLSIQFQTLKTVKAVNTVANC